VKVRPAVGRPSGTQFEVRNPLHTTYAGCKCKGAVLDSQLPPKSGQISMRCGWVRRSVSIQLRVGCESEILAYSKTPKIASEVTLEEDSPELRAL
jgi:hypothetical protein